MNEIFLGVETEVKHFFDIPTLHDVLTLGAFLGGAPGGGHINDPRNNEADVAPSTVFSELTWGGVYPTFSEGWKHFFRGVGILFP